MRRFGTVRWERIRGGRTALALVLAALTCMLAAAAPASASAAERVYVSLTFDDGLDTQWEHRDVLDARGVKGTYYVSSGKTGRSGYMTWDQLRAMQDAGHEIGGHTRDHVNLVDSTPAQRQVQVCGDRAALEAQGLEVTNFAYPFGRQNTEVRDVVRGCGYDSGRTTGGTDYPDPCCIFSNPLSQDRRYFARAFQTSYEDTIDIYRDIVELARDHGGGWLPIVLHDVCSGACSGVEPDDYYVSAELLDEFIRWLQADSQIRIRTVAQVMALAGDRDAPAVELSAPQDGAVVRVGESVWLRAEARGRVAVDRVDFYVGGELAGSDATAPYEAGWTADALGPAEVYAVAVDDAGNEGRSPIRTVEVADLDEPEVELTAPEAGATVSGVVELTATASDATSPVERVEFLVDGVVIASDESAPYAADWDTATATPGADVMLAARAHDTAGNSATSTPREVTVAARRDDPDPPRRDDPDPPGREPEPPGREPEPPGRESEPPGREPEPPASGGEPTSGPTLRMRAGVGRGRTLDARVVASDPHGVRHVTLLVNGRTARAGVRVTRAGDGRRVRLVRSLRVRPGRYTLVAVARGARGHATRSKPARVVVRAAPRR